MLTGGLPQETPQQPSKFNPDLDEAWDEFILKSIAPNPSSRFGSANEMRDELDSLDAIWQQKKDNICQIAESTTHNDSPPKRLHLRSHPSKIPPRKAKRFFGVDELWRPENYTQNNFAPNADGTITDDSSGLVWQQAGSQYPMTWHEAGLYIAKINRNKFALRNTWRLPTVDELMSLLTITPHGEDFCIEPIFDPRQRALWSADRRSFTAAWYVSIDMGFVSWQDFSAYYHVRAVSDI
jgi:serine/threonine-protein kinase